MAANLLLLGAFAAIAALLTTRILRGPVWEVSPTDPLTFALVSIGLGAAALLACYASARRASGVNPIVALRVE